MRFQGEENVLLWERNGGGGYVEVGGPTLASISRRIIALFYTPSLSNLSCMVV